MGGAFIGYSARVFAVLGAFLVLGCGALIIIERRAHETFKPVEATISQLSTERYRDRRPDHHAYWYRPVARFSFRVDGQRYNGNRFTFWPTAYIAGDWAEQAMAPYETGQTTTAYYHPGNPHRAILTRRASPIFYSGVLFGSGVIAFCLMGWSLPKPRTWHQRPERTGKYFTLQPIERHRLRLRDYALGLVVWLGMGAVVLAFYHAQPAPLARPPVMAVIAVGLYLVVGPIGLHGILRQVRSFRWVDDPLVWLKNDRLALGRKNPVMLVQKARRTLTVEKLDVGARLHCVARVPVEGHDRTRLERNVLHETMHTCLQNQQVTSSASMQAETALRPPAELPPSTRDHSYPRYYWSIATRLKIKDGPVYEAEFPVQAVAEKAATPETPAIPQARIRRPR